MATAIRDSVKRRRTKSPELGNKLRGRFINVIWRQNGLIASAKWGISPSRIAGVAPAFSLKFSLVAAMKVRNSLKSLRTRHRANQLVRRKGRVYIINKVQKRFKARQG